jgi:uncharacterized protein (TIGR02284 family)
VSHTNEEIIGYLNDLIETCKDGENGFRTAAEHVGDEGETRLRTLLNAFAQQRALCAAELNNEVLRRGGEPAKSGHISSSLHRGWMNLKAAVSSKSESAILEECESGEKAAMENYQDALKKNLPRDLMEIVEEQYAGIREAHQRIRLLSRALKSVA